jgi:hypothetical protein
MLVHGKWQIAPHTVDMLTDRGSDKGQLCHHPQRPDCHNCQRMSHLTLCFASSDWYSDACTQSLAGSIELEIHKINGLYNAGVHYVPSTTIPQAWLDTQKTVIGERE